MSTKRLSIIGVAVCLLIPLLAFTTGLIHPMVMFYYIIIILQLLILAIPVCLCAFLYNIFRLIKPRDKRSWTRLAMYGVGVIVMFYAGILVQPVAFEGFYRHYKLNQYGFEEIRKWGQTVQFDDLPPYNRYWRTGEQIPPPLLHMKPMRVWVTTISESDLRRKVILNWGSSLAGFRYEIIILPPDVNYKEEYGIERKVEPGVYVTLSH